MNFNVFILFWIVSYSLTFSQSLDEAIDTSFSFLGMKTSDLSMPCDAVEYDQFRFQLLCSFFEKPLSTISYTNTFLTNTDFSPFSPSAYSSLIATLELPSYSHSQSTISISKKDEAKIRAEFKGYHKTDELISMINEIISSSSSIETQNSFLFSKVDNLLRNSEGEDNSDVYSFKLAEIASHNSSIKLFDSIYHHRKIISKNLFHGFILSQKLLQLQQLLEKNPLTLSKSFEITIDKQKSIVFGSSGDDIYTNSSFLIIDCKGNDTYRFTETKSTLETKPDRMILDIEGDDYYLGKDYSFGAGYFGVGILFDGKGNDHYVGGSLSLGTGVFGFGFLYDQGGSDTYTSGVSTQGAGAFGFGLLWDIGGNDVYTVQSQGQGFGYTLGFGILREEGGNDYFLTNSPFLDVLRYDNHFVTFTQGASLGFRPIASGGIGILSDTEGNDKYTSDIYGQGTAYWFGLGALVDSKGEDVYTSYQYSQGSGVHLAFGILIDSSGNDVYTSHGVSQGCGHDIAMGALIDFKGDDHYFVESLSLGSGNANASSLFYDLKGNDSYVGLNATNTFGYSDFRRNYGMMGIFFDATGIDHYNNTSKNSSISHKSTYGTFIDFNWKLTNGSNPTEKSISSSPTPYNHSEDLDSLFMEASTPLNKYQYIVAPARKKFSSLPQSEVIPFLVSKFSSVFPRDRLALEMILPDVYEKSPLWEQVVIDSLSNSQNIRVISICSYLATKKAIKKVLPIYKSLLGSKNWKVSSLIAERIGEIGDSSFVELLYSNFNSIHPYVRSKIALSIGILSNGSIFQNSATIINDQEQVVRNNYIAGLLQKDSISVNLFETLSKQCNSHESKISVLRLVQKIELTQKSKQLIEQIYPTLQLSERAILLSELVNKRNKLYFADLLTTLSSKETDELLYNYFQ
jgi:hypothetical protein